MISKLWITMPAELGHLAPLGEAMRRVLTELRANPQIAEAVELCVSEAATNAIERVAAAAGTRRIEVQVSVEAGDVLRIVIGDRGARLPSEAPILTFDPHDRTSWPENGMGLYLIHQLMTDVQYRSDPTSNVIHMSCSLKPP
jgi:anti-sigma regulatory factor (Ser/Thr protein kinase)